MVLLPARLLQQEPLKEPATAVVVGWMGVGFAGSQNIIEKTALLDFIRETGVEGLLDNLGHGNVDGFGL